MEVFSYFTFSHQSNSSVVHNFLSQLALQIQKFIFGRSNATLFLLNIVHTLI